MPRQSRVHVRGALYYVSKQSAEPVFIGENDFRCFLSLLDVTRRRCRIRVHAFCLEPHSVHLALQVRDMSVSRFMQRLMAAYVLKTRERRNKRMPMFTSRHYQRMIPAISLLSLVRVIHAIPVTSGLAACADDYAWSSAAGYSRAAHYPWLTTRTTLRRLSLRTSEAHAIFQQLSQKGITPEELKSLGVAALGTSLVPRNRPKATRRPLDNTSRLPLLLLPGVNAPTIRRQ